MVNNNLSPLAMNTVDTVSNASASAPRITGLVKQSGKVTGYKLSDNRTLSKQEAISLARSNGIYGVGVSHRGNTEYLKSLPDNTQNNNLGNLPSTSLD